MTSYVSNFNANCFQNHNSQIKKILKLLKLFKANSYAVQSYLRRWGLKLMALGPNGYGAGA